MGDNKRLKKTKETKETNGGIRRRQEGTERDWGD